MWKNNFSSLSLSFRLAGVFYCCSWCSCWPPKIKLAECFIFNCVLFFIVQRLTKLGCAKLDKPTSSPTRMWICWILGFCLSRAVKKKKIKKKIILVGGEGEKFSLGAGSEPKKKVLPPMAPLPTTRQTRRKKNLLICGRKNWPHEKIVFFLFFLGSKSERGQGFFK